MNNTKITRREHRFLDSLLTYDWTKGCPAGVGQKTIQNCLDRGWVRARVERDGGPARAYELTPIGDAVLAQAGANPAAFMAEVISQ